MITPILYRGVWPQVVAKLAKYAVKFIDGRWKITVLYQAGDGLLFLTVEGGGVDLVSRINAVETSAGEQPGGAFYVNEHRHVIAPVKGDASSGTGSLYYFVCRLEGDFRFEFEGRLLTSKPVHLDGTPLKPGERWVGPRPGIPYKLAAGGQDIFFESPALTDGDFPAVRPMMTRRVQLSRVLHDKALLARAVGPIASIREHQGGRFYVNEHGAIFTPVGAGDGDGIDYIYCGQIGAPAWLPEPNAG